MNRFPTPWQQKTLWAALTSVALVAIGAISVSLVWLASQVVGFLQPILIPFAIAGVMAYLLDPVVERLVGWGMSRHRSVLCVFAAVSVALAGILIWVVPSASREAVQLARKLPKLTADARHLLEDVAQEARKKYNLQLLPEFPTLEHTLSEVKDVAGPGVEGGQSSGGGGGGSALAPLTVAPPEVMWDLQQFLSGDWLRRALPLVFRNTWNFISASVGGFLGVFGFLLSMVIVPVYLYYFLIESRHISESWGDYLPLRSSRFKDEVVETLEEINGYLMAFFRGQLLVSLINGAATGVGLLVVGLDFGLLIGCTLCVLGLIPYLGIILCWVPAVLIAVVHGGSWLLPASPWWLFPLVVTGIFVVVQQIDGLFVTPKIVGESVGLHPMTVIVSVFVWSLLMGGLLGAILAVPMTATLKVLLKRYVWQRRFFPPDSGLGGLGDVSMGEERSGADGDETKGV
jgi:predicted PurR-regulated permease PerM